MVDVRQAGGFARLINTSGERSEALPAFKKKKGDTRYEASPFLDFDR